MADTIFYYSDSTTSTSSNTILVPSSRNLTKTLISVDIGDIVTAIGSLAFNYCESLTNIIIPNNVISIGDDAFSGSGLINVYISESVTIIGAYAFANCSNLTKINIPKNISTIPLAFALNCVNLLNIDISDNVTAIEFYAFQNCSSLKEVILPKNITNLSDYIFYQCANLDKIFFKGNAPTLGNFSLNDTSINLKLYRKKNFVTGWGPTLDGKPVVLWSDNVIKSGGTGRLTTKKRN